MINYFKKILNSFYLIEYYKDGYPHGKTIFAKSWEEAEEKVKEYKLGKVLGTKVFSLRLFFINTFIWW